MAEKAQMAGIRISKQFNDLLKPYITGALDEMARQTDRGAAIVGTTLIDLMLREAIEKELRPIQDLRDRLFTQRGPLQEFAHRTLIAYGMGIIGSWAYEDMSKLKDIRNAFAHSADTIDFNYEPISVRCGQLRYPAKFPYIGLPAPITSREKFERAIKQFADGLAEYIGKSPVQKQNLFIQLGERRTRL